MDSCRHGLTLEACFECKCARLSGRLATSQVQCAVLAEALEAISRMSSTTKLRNVADNALANYHEIKWG